MTVSTHVKRHWEGTNVHTDTQAENRVENRCSANTSPRPERFSLMVASLLQRAIARKISSSCLRLWPCLVRLKFWIPCKTHCATDEASSCIDVVQFRHVSHLGKNVICDWPTFNVHSVIGVEIWYCTRSVLDLECVAVGDIRVWFAFVVEIVILKSHVNLLTWRTHSKWSVVLRIFDSHGSPLTHWTHLTSRSAKRVVHQGPCTARVHELNKNVLELVTEITNDDSLVRIHCVTEITNFRLVQHCASLWESESCIRFPAYSLTGQVNNCCAFPTTWWRVSSQSSSVTFSPACTTVWADSLVNVQHHVPNTFHRFPNELVKKCFPLRTRPLCSPIRVSHSSISPIVNGSSTWMVPGGISRSQGYQPRCPTGSLKTIEMPSLDHWAPSAISRRTGCRSELQWAAWWILYRVKVCSSTPRKNRSALRSTPRSYWCKEGYAQPRVLVLRKKLFPNLCHGTVWPQIWISLDLMRHLEFRHFHYRIFHRSLELVHSSMKIFHGCGLFLSRLCVRCQYHTNPCVRHRPRPPPSSE